MKNKEKYYNQKNVLMLLEKKMLFSGDVIKISDLMKIFGNNKGNYNYWIKKLQEEWYLWKFNKDTFVYTYNKSPKDAIIKYFNYIKEPYYFGGMQLFNEYGFTTQISQTLEIFNSKNTGLKKINGTFFYFNKIKKCYFGKGILKDGNITKERFIIDFLLINNLYISENRITLIFLQSLKKDLEKMNIYSYIKTYPNIIKQKILGYLETIKCNNLDIELSNIGNILTRNYIQLNTQKGIKENVFRNKKTRTLYYY